jgi:hypothetical protein
MAKVLIAVMRDKKLPSKSSKTPISLESKVRYALHCLEADEHGPKKTRAVEFLKKARSRLDNPDLASRIDEVLKDGT